MGKQDWMPLFEGKAPALNAKDQIEYIAFTRKVVAKTASYTVKPEDSGCIFIANGGAEVTFTLPAVADGAGCEFEFVNKADQHMHITAAAADILVAFNDEAATSISFETAGDLIGGAVRIIGDGAHWYAIEEGNPGAVRTIA